MSDSDPVFNQDLAVRTFVYQHFVQTARPPTVAETAVHFNLPETTIKKSYQRLHDNHFFFLEPGTLDIRMANPFSALPTKFRVQVGQVAYWANCAWDMLGIPAALHQDAVIEAGYEDGGERPYSPSPTASYSTAVASFTFPCPCSSGTTI